MKKLILTIFAIVGVCALSAQTHKHIEWAFSTKRTAHYLEKGHYHASKGEGAIEFVGKKATATVGVKKYYPAAEGTRKGDYWLMTIPVENIEAGTTVDVWFPFLVAEADTPHAFAWSISMAKSGSLFCPPTRRVQTATQPLPRSGLVSFGVQSNSKRVSKRAICRSVCAIATRR